MATATALFSLVLGSVPAVAQPAEPFSALVTDVSAAQGQIDDLELEMGELREEVNRKLVDLHEAQGEAELARQRAAEARTLLERAQGDLQAAQDELDDLARAAYRQGATAPAVTAVTGADARADALDRKAFLRQRVEEQQAVVDDLDRVRTRSANEESRLRQASEEADAREAEAAVAEADAREALGANGERLDEVAEARGGLVAARDAAQVDLVAARGTGPDEGGSPEPAPVDVPAESQAAADAVAELQPAHTVLENPYPSDPDADPVDVASVWGPEVTETVDAPRDAQVETVIARARSQMGVPYAWGGGNAFGPTAGVRDGASADAHGDFTKVGFDCSGLTQYAFAGVGVNLPHYTGYQYRRGEKVDPQEMQRGDLIFYGADGSKHVAIYLGDGKMIEAPTSGGAVRETPVRWAGMAEHAVRLI